MQPTPIRDALRQQNSEDLRWRRNIIRLSALGILDFTVISLYQTGIIRSLPDLPGKIFDSNHVNASPDAYVLGVPDGPVSLGAYAANMVLAAWGGDNASGRKPLADLALGAVILGNAAGAAHFMWNMITKQKKVCLYCVTGALINFASAAIAAPHVWKSLKKMGKS